MPAVKAVESGRGGAVFFKIHDKYVVRPVLPAERKHLDVKKRQGHRRILSVPTASYNIHNDCVRRIGERC